MTHFIIKSRPDCIWCVRAKELLAEHGESFTEQMHSTDAEIAAFKHAGFSTFPQIFADGQHIGGYAELTAYYFNQKHTFRSKK